MSRHPPPSKLGEFAIPLLFRNRISATRRNGNKRRLDPAKIRLALSRSTVDKTSEEVYGAVCTKHPGFAEEVEWRVIHFPWWENSAHLIKETEVIQGVPRPVYKIPLVDIPEEGLFGLTIPALFDRIIIGPTRDPLAMREAFMDLLVKADVEQPHNKVFVSDIPLRQ
jgi:hypothetical protein